MIILIQFRMLMSKVVSSFLSEKWNISMVSSQKLKSLVFFLIYEFLLLVLLELKEFDCAINRR